MDTHPRDPRHPNVIKARAQYGNALASADKREAGIRELEEAIRGATTVFGPESMTVGVYLQNIVRYQLQAGMVSEALESSRRSLEICERFFPRGSHTRMSAAPARGAALAEAFRNRESLHRGL